MNPSRKIEDFYEKWENFDKMPTEQSLYSHKFTFWSLQTTEWKPQIFYSFDFFPNVKPALKLGWRTLWSARPIVFLKKNWINRKKFQWSTNVFFKRFLSRRKKIYQSLLFLHQTLFTKLSIKCWLKLYNWLLLDAKH